jgi:GTPase KRas
MLFSYSTLRICEIRMNEGFVLAYSTSSRQSFNCILNYYQLIQRTKGDERYSCIIAATKSDREGREVSTEGTVLPSSDPSSQSSRN